MPEKQQVKYTNTAPEKFSAKYDYDTINVVIPTNNQQMTFYSLRESVVEASPTSSVTSTIAIELPPSDVVLSSGQWNKDRIMEIAQDFHKAQGMLTLLFKAEKVNSMADL